MGGNWDLVNLGPSPHGYATFCIHRSFIPEVKKFLRGPKWQRQGIHIEIHKVQRKCSMTMCGAEKCR